MRHATEALVDADGGRPGAADDCDACMNDRDCTTTAFACSVECAGIVP